MHLGAGTITRETAFAPPAYVRQVRARARLLTAAALAFAIAGCATLDPEAIKPSGPAVTAPAKEPEVPAAAPRITGIETRAAADQRYVVGLFGGIYRSPAAENHLNGILARLALASSNPQEAYKVTLLNSPVVNAFALPSGDLFVTRGLLALANDSSEIGAVMAHEIAHVTMRHAVQREEQKKIVDLRERVANHIQTRQRGEEVQATGLLNLASFSRQQELEADRIGVALIGKAGYDPYGASRFLRQLERSLEIRGCQQNTPSQRTQLDILSSHPANPERIKQAIAAARAIGAPGIGDTGRDAYLNAINGIDFGDDPSEGIVRGLNFTHTKLGFAFSAPPGFALENCSQAMIGVTASRVEAVRLDIVQLPAATGMTDYVASGWVEGLRKDTVEARQINGLQGAIGLAEHNGWKFRVAVARLNGEVARIIFAAKSLTPAMDEAFLASIMTFRKLQAGESQRLRAPRIAVVQASASETAEQMARRMAAGSRGLDLFLTLNGLKKGEPLDTGDSYKIVAE